VECEILAVSLGTLFVWIFARLFLPPLRSWAQLLLVALVAYGLGWSVWGPGDPVRALAAAGGAVLLDVAFRSLQAFSDLREIELLRTTRGR
jgi:hypothetical protein